MLTGNDFYENRVTNKNTELVSIPRLSIVMTRHLASGRFAMIPYSLAKPQIRELRIDIIGAAAVT